MTDSNREPERRMAPDGVYVGALRVSVGAAPLIHALAQSLPPGCLCTGLAIHVLHDRGAFIERFGCIKD